MDKEKSYYSNPMILPEKVRGGYGWESLKKMGFEIIKTEDKDKSILYVYGRKVYVGVNAPKDWHIYFVNEFWLDLVDNMGRVRGRIFSKSDNGRIICHLDLVRRYNAKMEIHPDRTAHILDTPIRGVVTDQGKVIYCTEFKTWVWEVCDYQTFEDLIKTEVNQWMKQNYPKWEDQDITVYWD